MSGWYRHWLRPWLFRQDSEAAHDRALRVLAGVARSPALTRLMAGACGAPALRTRAFGLDFPNPVGVAAGMDKAASAAPVWEALGFGFAELGGVTRLAQPGNPKPRVFRAVEDEALVNSMGFNNPGAEAFAATLRAWKTAGRWPRIPIGVNLGKSKITPLEEAAADYLDSFTRLRGLADFFVVNVSSPNTPNLRKLQERSALAEILSALQEANGGPRARSDSEGESVVESGAPLLVKVAPDLSFDALDEIVELCAEHRLAGMVATNTTLSRPETANPKLASIYARPGGLSGRPLRARSTEVIRHLRRQTHGRMEIIGVGGIFTAQDAWEKILAGASVVQLYTGFVYGGPKVVREIVEGLARRLEGSGARSISEVVGAEGDL